MELEYNTSREKMRMPEYGRSVLKMVESLKGIEDRKKRSEQAAAVVKTMEILNPSVRQQENWERKLWDHLYIIAGFDLDIDSPYPCPEPSEFDTKPVPVPMKGDKIAALHYGRNIGKIMDLVCEQPEGEVKTELIRNLAIYMRQQYLIWNKDSVVDSTIFADIERLSAGRIVVPEGMELTKIAADADFSRPSFNISPSSSSQRKKNRRKNNNNRRHQK